MPVLPKPPKVNYSKYTDKFGPEALAKWKKFSFINYTNYVSLYQFLLINKDLFHKELGSHDFYHNTIKELWTTFTDEQINSNHTEKTILLYTIQLSNDPEVLQFAIDHTSNKGVNLRCQYKVEYAHYALPAAIAKGKKSCIVALIERSSGDALKAGMERAHGKRPRFASDYAPTVYSDTEIDYYEKLMKARQFGWLAFKAMQQFLGPLPQPVASVKPVASSAMAPNTVQAYSAPSEQPTIAPVPVCS